MSKIVREMPEKVKSYRRKPTEVASKKLLHQVGDAIRSKHYSIRTETAHIGRKSTTPTSIAGAPEIQTLLTHLIVEQEVTTSTPRRTAVPESW